MRILALEDDLSLLETYRMRLEDAGYEVLAATSAAAALLYVLNHPIDAAIVDLKLGDARYGGISFIRECAKRNAFFPVLIVTGTTIEQARKDVERMFGQSVLHFGADYMEKRAGDWLWEVADRLRNLIDPRRLLVFPPFVYDCHTRVISRDNAALQIKGISLRILEYLIRRPRRPVPALALFHEIYGDDNEFDDDHVELSEQEANKLQKQISTLRAKLDPDKELQPIALTEDGYRWALAPEKRSSTAGDAKRVIVPPYQLEIEFAQLLVSGRPAPMIELTPEECRVLEVLMRSAGLWRSRAWIHERAFGVDDIGHLKDTADLLLALQRKINSGAGGPVRNTIGRRGTYYGFCPAA